MLRRKATPAQNDCILARYHWLVSETRNNGHQVSRCFEQVNSFWERTLLDAMHESAHIDPSTMS